MAGVGPDVVPPPGHGRQGAGPIARDPRAAQRRGGHSFRLGRCGPQVAAERGVSRGRGPRLGGPRCPR
eukprot:5530868-Lingulodinium_polyedra.AAC.1